MTATELSKFISKKAKLLGFEACGFAKAEPLENDTRFFFNNWLKDERHGEMGYMANNIEKRMDPTLLVEGCKSVVVVALNYYPIEKQKNGLPKVARFAFGKDYHFIIRDLLKQLIDAIRIAGVEVSGRAFSDSAPIAERYWAAKAGLGWIGKNRQLILPQKGSYFLLGTLLIDQELDYGIQLKSHCGSCRKCLVACPTNALNNGSLDSKKCLSYLTVEKKGPFSDTESNLMRKNDWIFGCDICQECCPWNRFATPPENSLLKPKNEFLSMEMVDFENLIPEKFSTIFGGTCVERTGYTGLKRNLEAIKKET